MSSLNTSPSAGNTVVDKLKTYEGGTGQTAAAAALAALGGVASTLVNQPSGIAGLDANKKLSAGVLPTDYLSVISVQGPASVYKNSTNTYSITNYDAFATYTITPINGTVTRSNDTITFVASSTVGAGGFIINGRQFNVAIADFAPATPVLSVTDAGGSGTNVVGIFTSSAFVMNGNSDTHLNSDWQVATDNAFATVVRSSLADATNKTSWTVSDLAQVTTYYCRVRYRSSSGLISAWSNTFVLTTKNNYIPKNEQAKILAADRATSDNGGYAVSLSADGTRLAIGAPNKTVNSIAGAGVVYIYVRSGGTWTLEQRLQQASVTSANANETFGFNVALSGDGARVAVGVPNSKATVAIGGQVVMFVRNTSTNTWTQEQLIAPPSPFGGGVFGYSVSLDNTGTRMVAGQPTSSPGSSEYPFTHAYVFVRNTSTNVWTTEQTLQYTGAGGSSFGWSVSIDSTGTRLAVGAPGEWDSDEANVSGFVYMWVRNTSTNVWTIETKIGSSRGFNPDSDLFGYGVAISRDGTRVAIGAPADASGANNSGLGYCALRTGSSWAIVGNSLSADILGSSFGQCVATNIDGTIVAMSLGQNNPGAVYIYKLVSTTWTQQAKVQCSDKTTTGLNNSFAMLGLAMDYYAATMACGAFNDNNTIAHSGATYIYTP